MKTLPSSIEIIVGQHPGPSVVVMGAVHGNERLGAKVIATLKKSIKAEELHGTLTLILGNPAAYALDKRFVDTDLNRLFGSEINALTKKEAGLLNREEKRALEVAPFLENADYLLDIHSTIKPSVPFVYCEPTPRHLELARLFGTQYIVSPASDGHTVDLHCATDNYVDAHGGVGLTYEAGWHKKPSALAKVLEKTHHFLKAVGSFPPIYLEIYETIIPQNADFKFAKDVSNFDTINGSLIIFPKIEIIPGKPVGYLARIHHPLIPPHHD